MDIKLKHRVIGAIVIVALVVIFVPMLFTKNRSANSATIQNPPAVPQVPQVNQPPKMQAPQVQSSQAKAAQSESAATQQPIVKPMNMPAVPETLNTSEEHQLQPQTSEKTYSQEASVKATMPIEQHKIAKKTAAVFSKGSKPSVLIQKPKVKKTTQKTVTKTTQHQATTKPAFHINAPLHETMQKWQIRKTTLTSSNVAKPTIKKVIPQPPKKRLAIAQSHNMAWVVQVGSFSEEQHAKSLIHQLRQKDFTAFGYKTKSGAMVTTRVYVGPSVTREQAKAMAEHLQSKAKIKGIVVKFAATTLH